LELTGVRGVRVQRKQELGLAGGGGDTVKYEIIEVEWVEVVTRGRLRGPARE
jgi:hypothetical protein